jgi:hypothetical protein
MSDPVAFVRAYLDQFEGENWDGRGIKSAEVLSAEWERAVVQGQLTTIARATVQLNGRIEMLECWADDPPSVGGGHIFRSGAT